MATSTLHKLFLRHTLNEVSTLTEQDIFGIYQKAYPDNPDDRNMQNAKHIISLAKKIKVLGIDTSDARYLYRNPVSKKIVERILQIKLPNTQKGMFEYFHPTSPNAEKQGYICYLMAYFYDYDDPDDGRTFEVVTKKKDFDLVESMFKQKYPDVIKITDMIFDKERVTYRANENLLDRIKEYGI